MPTPLDTNVCRQLGKYVETLTHTGQKTLDKDILKKLKSICKMSDGYVEHTYHLLVYHLEKPHAEIRFSAFQICDELFRRSHCFRELIVSNLQHLMELTCETSSENPLPLPRSVALNLKRLALQTIHMWDKEYGDGYKKLHLGYNFLKHCKKVDFNTLEMENSAEQVRQQEQERRQSLINQEKLKKLKLEIDETLPDITGTLTSLENCVALLLPTLEDFFIQDDSPGKLCGENNNDFPSVKVLDENIKKVHDSDQISIYLDKNKDQAQEKDNKDMTMVKTCEDNNSDNEEEDDKTSDSESEISEPENIDLREYGIHSKFNIEINVVKDSVPVKETNENEAIFENAKDMYILIQNRFLPMVKKWIQIITKSSEKSEELKKLLDLKQSLEKATRKYLHLKDQAMNNNSSDSSDSDFEEVQEKEGYEENPKIDILLPGPSSETSGKNKPKSGMDKQSVWNIWSEENNEKDPTSAQSTLSTLKLSVPNKRTSVKQSESQTKDLSKNKYEMEPVPSTSKAGSDGMVEESRKAKLLAVAPKVPFGIDLYHWGDENVGVSTMVAVRAEGSRFWNSTQEELEEVPIPDDLSDLRTRVIEFTGKFEPVKWACRAPLPNGKLCPRQDRYKCPFHGPVVARDKTGKCSNTEDEQKLAKKEKEKNQECPDWQDPQLLEEIKQSTGIDLKMPDKNKKRKKKKKDKYPGLTDISVRQNTAYTRLSKKIFKRGTMKRVAKAMDVSDHKRFRDKYGDQFHYMYNTS